MNLSISLSGIRTAFERQGVTSNNIANATTPAYKTKRVSQVDVRSGGTDIGSISANMSQGSLEISDRSLDLAIQGEGFFRVSTPAGDRFTRSGSFHLDAHGQMVTGDGFQISPAVQLPADAESLSIESDGSVFARYASGDLVQVGRIEVNRFANPNGLREEGNSLYSVDANAGPVQAGSPGQGVNGDIAVGALEGSNVDLASEIVAQIENKASANANIHAVKAENDMMESLLDIIA